ncbi:MAG: hypothetical protein A3J09_00470 [Candidatus Zambryskibacteria bacterium RIFCSPLOWO2_02_FULL_51_21]|uniref:Rod shape-determining protein MreD n=1 Tax=Candidatus Zambryskibacteria bacterium RIFCSPHIGHO2_02_FULL_43_37 TaxID=1802749 RepID=A0A1G2THA2_9BACT|nr:MAG: hypothetical protein A2723_00470 [Candidatus Zambryskibacteria bacterium RIFCSPHIGHO2_01_FULL_52_18]OHA96684.1 MAG: hypothetical protein A3D49_02430 [Candidatus Zambryskibacteria bacterium RIFCSPHIGHO2_02_FULL_43_37]OHB06707.1 MAG: hypothetical protein A2944_02560 [Candidatus Zambryskibacteria bacterium RIFCSPLOWO2_01_FULL_52_12]OHB11040.1 MAG: hypothetical protein A3J09_00470 [Candidatus Zambryskibacteria bacterium RIFCSPLOWO2_02_FULL_51_21]
MKNLRVISSIVLILSVIFLPSYIYLPALALAIIVLPFFWEGVLIAFLIDALYGPGVSSLASIFSTFGFYSAVLLAVVVPVRRRLRTYA